MEIGKFPPALLGQLLGSVVIDDPRVVLGPKVGEDAAALDFGDRLLVAKTDPVTFATDRAGWYSVQVCANDVACTGATPRWFLATILVPEAFTEEDASSLFQDVLNACNELGIALIGGHSEVTHGIQRPIVMGTMLGEVDRGGLVTTGGAQEGDSIVLTKGLAIEGTAILARDCADALKDAGVHASTIEGGASLLHSPGISVLQDARVAVAQNAVHAMHDVTEGGLVTAFHEMAEASGLGVALEEGSVPLLPETEEACNALGLDPLGLLGSGALLIALPAAAAPRLLRDLERSDIDAWEIGQVLPAEEGRILFSRSGDEIALPTSERDELARFFAQQ